jgi:dihydroxyacetone kinase-like protein
MKKLINRVEDVVKEELEGVAAAHSDLVRVHYAPNYVVRADAPVSGKTALVSGGGSGHEPMHGGFVGMGMLDAACPGEVFTSPTPDQILEATKAVSGGAGVLHLVKNYTGDILNFEMAADLAKADDIEVEAVVINDGIPGWLPALRVKDQIDAADHQEDVAIQVYETWSEMEKVRQVLAATTINEVDAPWRHAA